MKLIVKLLPVLLIALAPAAFAESTIYNSILSPLPPNDWSFAYEATSSSQFGELIQFAGSSSSNALTSATVVMSDWAVASDYPTITGSGFYVPLTLSLYNVGDANTVGSLIGSNTVDALIPWRPAASAGCGSAYSGSDGLCYNGSFSTVTFDLAGIVAPNQIIYGLSFNTTDYGANPTHVPGPYDSLNFGLSTADPTVGSNLLPGSAYLNSTWPGAYQAGGGTGTFRLDPTGWNAPDPDPGYTDAGLPFNGAIQFDAASPTPEPSSLILLGTGILGLAGAVRRRFLHA